VWVALSDPHADELGELGAVFDLPQVSVEPRRDRHERPRLEAHGQITILTLKTVRHAPGRRWSPARSTSSSAGARRSPSASRVLKRSHVRASALGTRPGVAVHGPMAAAWAVIDAVIDKCERVVDALDDQLERTEVAVFEGDEEQSQPIYFRLQEAVRLARLMHPTLTVLDRLERGGLVECPSALAPLFGDVSDRARRLSDEVTMLGEALDGLLNDNLARVTVRQNVIIQQVSAWAAIAAAATIITGIYGMNFRHMPELAGSWATRWRSRS